MAFVLDYKMSNQNVIEVYLNAEFAKGRRQKIVLKDRKKRVPVIFGLYKRRW
jgi:hypothetical protein